MRTLFFLLASTCVGFGITHEVHPIFQALSLHGTDMGEEMDGEVIQAQVSQFPAVVVGALPEALIDKIGEPHRLPGPDSYKVPEANLLVLYGIGLESEMTAEGLSCIFDLKKLKVPEGLEISTRAVLQLAIQAVKDTLDTFYRDAQATQKVMIKIIGTSEKNAAFKNLATDFKAGK